MLSLLWSWVQSLVRELRSYKLWSTVRKDRKREREREGGREEERKEGREEGREEGRKERKKRKRKKRKKRKERKKKRKRKEKERKEERKKKKMNGCLRERRKSLMFHQLVSLISSVWVVCCYLTNHHVIHWLKTGTAMPLLKILQLR